MRPISKLALLCAGMLCASWTLAQQPPTGAPAGTTGLCNDGTYWSGATRKGACHGHKGIKEWYGSAATAAPAAPAGRAAATTNTPAAAPAPAPQAAATPAAAKSASALTTAAAAPGGGPGQVWVNHKSKVYHCSGDRWYGKTKDGEYMTEAAATAAGYRPDHGKPCK